MVQGGEGVGKDVCFDRSNILSSSVATYARDVYVYVYVYVYVCSSLL